MMFIRPYTAADEQACVAVFESNLPLFFDASEKALLQHWLQACGSGQLAHAANTAEYFYVLEQDNQVIACGGFYISGQNRANMVWGMVHSAHHKKNLGKLLLQHRIAAIKKNYPACVITLDTSQHTFLFFERLGFKLTKITDNYYGPGLHRYDMELV